MIRGEIGNARMSRFDPEQEAQSMTTVTVTMDVVTRSAKDCLDRMLSTAYDIALTPVERPF